MSPVQPDSDNSTTVDSAVLISTLDTIDSIPYHLASPITLAAQRTVKQLRIILVSSLFNLPAPENYVSNDSSSTIQYGVSRTSRWDEVQRLLTYVYVQATKVAQELGKILMDVDVLLQGTSSNIPDIPKESIERVYAGMHAVPFLNMHSPKYAPDVSSALFGQPTGNSSSSLHSILLADQYHMD